MSNTIAPRYQTTYREDEVRLIISFAIRGESLGFMGMAGIGKSNLVNFLRNIQQQTSPLQQEAQNLYFPVVDATYWQRTPSHLWKMMLEALTQATKDLPLPQAEEKIISIDEEERNLGALQSRLRRICQEHGRKVMFVLDDFDNVFETGPLPMLERLNGLRSEGNRGLLSYLVFTKLLPHVLGREYDLANKSKFYDLFCHHIYALEPYTPEDARQMLVHLNENAGRPLRSMELSQVRQLAGGHGQLLKIVFNLCLQEGLPGSDAVAHFAASPDVQQECRRILRNLHPEEQAVALKLARGQHANEESPLVDHLFRRGLLLAMEPVTWFSPLWEHFLKNYKLSRAG
jgi:hypothetical protein